jgi:hypothetical protein
VSNRPAGTPVQERASAPAKRLRFKNKLFSLDATVVELCLEMFDWAKYRQTKIPFSPGRFEEEQGLF